MKILNYSIKLILTFATVAFMSLTFGLVGVKPAKAQSTANYSAVLSFDKGTLKAGDDFQVSIIVTNNGSQLTNFEVRVPFYKSIIDAPLVTEAPAFNKILDSNEYPAGYSSRSWIINSFDAGESKTFLSKYKVSTEPKTPNGLVSNVTLPDSWKDPKGLQSGVPLVLSTFRADIYVANVYSSSYEVALPKLAELDNQVSVVKLNPIYSFPGTKSTNLKDVTNANIKAFPNFKLETADVLVEWINPIDFSGVDIVAGLSGLDQSFKPQWGKLEVVPGQLTFLNKPVKVTFKNVDLVFEPKLKVGAVVGPLIDGKGLWIKDAKNVVVSSDTLNTLAVAPNIISDQNIIETSESNIKIKGKTSDPRSVVTFNVDKLGPKEVSGVDLQTGEFEFILDKPDKINQIEISSKFKNGETDTKAILVKFKVAQAVALMTPIETPKTVSLLFNPITKFLLLAASAILSVICGYIYYLYYRRSKLMKTGLFRRNDDPLGPITAEIIKLHNSEDIFQSKTPAQQPSIDLNALKKQYLLKPDSENSPRGEGETNFDEKKNNSLLGKD